MAASSSRTELPFAALLTYSPRGESVASRASQGVVLDLKADRVIATTRGTMAASKYLALRLAEELPQSPFPRWFEGAVLVPMPRSAPLKKGALWPAFQIASEMYQQGLGQSVVPCLERVVAVPKSAFSPSNERPGPLRHYESLATSGAPPLGTSRVVLVDDVVTRGASFAGAAMRILASHGQFEVAAFAAVRTMSAQEVEAILAPCVGVIRREADRVVRRP